MAATYHTFSVILFTTHKLRDKILIVINQSFSWDRSVKAKKVGKLRKLRSVHCEESHNDGISYFYFLSFNLVLCFKFLKRRDLKDFVLVQAFSKLSKKLPQNWEQKCFFVYLEVNLYRIAIKEIFF